MSRDPWRLSHHPGREAPALPPLAVTCPANISTTHTWFILNSPHPLIITAVQSIHYKPWSHPKPTFATSLCAPHPASIGWTLGWMNFLRPSTPQFHANLGPGEGEWFVDCIVWKSLRELHITSLCLHSWKLKKMCAQYTAKGNNSNSGQVPNELCALQTILGLKDLGRGEKKKKKLFLTL